MSSVHWKSSISTTDGIEWHCTLTKPLLHSNSIRSSPGTFNTGGLDGSAHEILKARIAVKSVTFSTVTNRFEFPIAQLTPFINELETRIADSIVPGYR
jgi:hypothetical protein